MLDVHIREGNTYALNTTDWTVDADTIHWFPSSANHLITFIIHDNTNFPNVSVGDIVGFDSVDDATAPTVIMQISSVNNSTDRISAHVQTGNSAISENPSNAIWDHFYRLETSDLSDGDVIAWDDTNDDWRRKTLPQVFVQDAIPTSVSIGDLWIRATTSGQNRIFMATDTGIDRTDPRDEWVELARTRVSVQDNVPTQNVLVGDIWVDDTDDRAYIAMSNGATQVADGEWVRIDDPTNVTGLIGTGDGINTVGDELVVDLATDSGLGFDSGQLQLDANLSDLNDVEEGDAHKIAQNIPLYLTGQSGAWDILIDRGNVHRVLIRSLVNPTDLGLSSGDEIKIPVTLNDGSQAFIPTTYANTTTGTHNGRTIHDTFVNLDPDQDDWDDDVDYQNIEDVFGVTSIGTASEGWTDVQEVYNWIESNVNFLRQDNSNIQLRVHDVYFSKDVAADGHVALSKGEGDTVYQEVDSAHARTHLDVYSKAETETEILNSANTLVDIVRQDFLDLVNNATDRHRNVTGDFTIVWCGGHYYPGNESTTADYGYEFNTHTGHTGIPLVPRDGTKQSDFTTGNPINVYLVGGLSRVSDDDSDGTGYHYCANAITDDSVFSAFFGASGNAKWKDNPSGTYDFEHNIQSFGRDNNSSLQASFDNSRTMFGYP